MVWDTQAYSARTGHLAAVSRAEFRQPVSEDLMQTQVPELVNLYALIHSVAEDCELAYSPKS